MKITKIEEQKHNSERVNIYVDGEYKFSLTLDSCVDNYLYEGREITEEDIRKFSDGDSKILALNYLNYQLGFGMKTEKEMRDKLRKKEYREEDIDYAISKGKKYGYIDDDNYVKCYIKQRALQNDWGPTKVMGMLLQKGIDKEIIQDGINKYMTNDDLYNAVIECGTKKYKLLDKSKNTPRQCRDKVLRYLISKGYTYDLCVQVVSNIMAFSNEDYD